MDKAMIDYLVERAKDDGVKLIDLQFSDFFGSLKNVTVPVERLEDVLKSGSWFDGSSVQGFARIYESDMYLMPDPDTYAVIPWSVDAGMTTARLICDVYKAETNKPFEGCPRSILKKVLKEAAEMGFGYNTGPELEFFVFPKDETGTPLIETPGNGYYFTHPLDESNEIQSGIVETLREFGIEPEMSHYEVAGNQHEIDFRYSDALKTADNAITFKYVVKNIASQYGWFATFMPKPIFGVNGSGMHVHQSLAQIKDGSNAFFDESDQYKLSETAKQFIAGQLQYIKSIAALVSPTVNSYKRLTPGFEAPVYVCWARTNRSAMIRIPRYSEGKEASTRAELRCPDPSANPYLAFAGMLKAGLRGIQEGLTPPKPMEEDVFEFDDTERKMKGVDVLPGTLGDALDAFEQGGFGKELFGAAYSEYLAARRKEWDDYRIAVTDWELDRYLQYL